MLIMGGEFGWTTLFTAIVSKLQYPEGYTFLNITIDIFSVRQFDFELYRT